MRNLSERIFEIPVLLYCCIFIVFFLSGRVKKAERSEPSLDVSEYNLVRSKAVARDAVRVQDLIKTLERKGDQDNIIKKLLQIRRKNKVLPKPLEKPAAEKVK